MTHQEWQGWVQLNKLTASDREYWHRLAEVTVPPNADPLADLVSRQIQFSFRTFGPGARTAGVVDHIRKELCEIEARPEDLTEWIDVILLAIDGYWRHGGRPEDLLPKMEAKFAKNRSRKWWPIVEGKAIEHIREEGEE